MVNSPQWVMFGDELYKVHTQVADKLFLVSKVSRYRTGGWTDPRGAGGFNPVIEIPEYIEVNVNDCQPITPEVADIMRSV